MALALIGIGAATRAAGVTLLMLTVAGMAAALAVTQVALGIRPLQSRWQVPERWRRMMDIDVVAGLYGVLLGMGILTAVVTSAFWVFLALTPVVSPFTALAGWSAYALSRAGGFWSMARTLRADEIYAQRTATRRILIGASSVVGLATVMLTAFS